MKDMQRTSSGASKSTRRNSTPEEALRSSLSAVTGIENAEILEQVGRDVFLDEAFAIENRSRQPISQVSHSVQAHETIVPVCVRIDDALKKISRVRESPPTRPFRSSVARKVW